ncbi:hypothetical protein GCM10010483_47830 [Actinokineospora diospyrosa]
MLAANSSGPRAAAVPVAGRTTPCATPEGAVADTECAISPTSDGSCHEESVDRNTSPSETDTPPRTDTGASGATARHPPSHAGRASARRVPRNRSQKDTPLTPLR